MYLEFDKEKLYNLMVDFYTLTKIRIVIHDNNFNNIMAVPEKSCEFCAALKKNPKAREKCLQCDMDGFTTCGKENKLTIYKCHSGLIEAVVPLKLNDINVGYIMFGQIIDKKQKKALKEEIVKYSSTYTDEPINEYYDRLTSKTTEQINSAARIMQACACYLLVSELIRVDDNNIILNLSEYIEKNLTNDLTVESICDHFNINRNKLYKIFKECFGMSIAKYIRKKRVEHARILLKKGAKVSDAACLSGFYDYNYFSKVFKQETGVLPRSVKNI